jgi:glycosyltransferase involved in cell wall biosynthesis
MLEPWALDYHAWRKRLAMCFYQRRDLEAAKLIFATAPQEMESIRRLGLKQPVAVIPNGVKLPTISYKETRNELTSSQNSVRNAVFMSRIHPKKGLLNLVESWGRIRPVNWHLRVAGPDEGGHLEEVMRRVRTLGLEAAVEYVGEVEGDTKIALFENADLFVLPSFSENFGVVVAEAMAHGVPVITTHGTPWEGLLHHGCGWWIKPTADALTEVLSEAMNMDEASLRSMGKKGREYASEFDWSNIAQQTVEVYQWVLGQGSKPACVLRD